MKCLKIPKYLQRISMIMICTACEQITTRYTNQKSIPIPGIVEQMETSSVTIISSEKVGRTT